MREKIISYLGFAQKSQNALIGIDNILRYRKKIFLVLVDNTASDRLKKDAEKLKVQRTEIRLVDGLEELTNRSGCKAIGITDENLASAIMGQIRGSI